MWALRAHASIARAVKNTKIFGKYINSKRQIHDHIGDLKTFDKDGNMQTACTDSDKAETLGNFFASVFNRESEFVEATAQPRPCEFSSQDPDISEQIILKKLNDLNVTKSPGPDNIHLRILYELRHELVLPLKIQLPADWTRRPASADRTARAANFRRNLEAT